MVRCTSIGLFSSSWIALLLAMTILATPVTIAATSKEIREISNLGTFNF
jgi:hypothetical protein